MTNDAKVSQKPEDYSAAEIGALAHLYRGEMYRSKMWRQRLDLTTNWAVGVTGIALSIVFSGPEHQPLMLILVSILVLVFLGIEARRYRYFDIWRTRVRLLEVAFYGPLLLGKGVSKDSGWAELMDNDLRTLRYHISYLEAFGRRLRRNYIWIFLVLSVSYLLKIAVHPTAIETVDQVWERTAIGPISGGLVISLGAVFWVVMLSVAIVTLYKSRAVGRVEELKDLQDDIVAFRRVE